MKIFILASLLLLSNAHAEECGFIVNEVTCGEIDPFVVGDACVIELSSKNKNIALVVDLESFLENFDSDASSYKDKLMMVQMHEIKKVSLKVSKVLQNDLGISKSTAIFSATVYDFNVSSID